MIWNKNNNNLINSSGFTIVELLIVIVVIGILAAISIVAYTGISQQASAATLKADLKNSQTVINLDKIKNDGKFPASIEEANEGKGLKKSPNTIYQYSVDNDANPPTFCLTARNDTQAFHVTESSSMLNGVCPGHTEPTGQSGGGNSGYGDNSPIANGVEITSIYYQESQVTAFQYTGSVDANSEPFSSGFPWIKSNNTPPPIVTDVSAWIGSVPVSISQGSEWTAFGDSTGLGLAYVGDLIVGDGSAETMYNFYQNGTITATIDGVPGNTIYIKNLASTVGPGYTDGNSITWTQRLEGNDEISDYQWRVVTSSGDGSKLAVFPDYSDTIKTSTDYGATWTNHNVGLQNEYFKDAAASFDGTKLVVVTQGGYVYFSSDSGSTWQISSSALTQNRFGVASSYNGQKIAVAAPAAIFTSTNAGASWVTQPAGSGWFRIASSSDGTKLVASKGPSGNIYTSTDSGVNWTQQNSAGSYPWQYLASSSDGSKLVAVFGSSVYMSQDSGITWGVHTFSDSMDLVSAASSADGSKIVVAAKTNGYIYFSSDSGQSWSRETVPGARDWRSVGISANGDRLIAVSGIGYIYTGIYN